MCARPPSSPATAASAPPCPTRSQALLRARRQARRAWLVSGWRRSSSRRSRPPSCFLLLGSEGPESPAPIAVGTPPLRVAAGAQAVWVTSEKDGTLTRLDPETGEVLGGRPARHRHLRRRDRQQMDLGDRPAGGTSCSASTRRAAASCKRIDLAGEPGPFALGGGRVWVADEGGAGITAVNAESGRRLPARPAAAGARTAPRLGRRRPLGQRSPTATSCAASTPAPSSPASRSGSAAAPPGSPSPTASSGSPTAATAGLQGRPARLQRGRDWFAVDGHPGGIDAGTSTVWVADTRRRHGRKIDLESGEAEGDPIEVGPEPGAVAVGGDAVWVANNGDGTVTRIEP